MIWTFLRNQRHASAAHGVARQASMERSKDASYQILVQRSRPARMGRARLSGDNAQRSARKPARKRKKTDDGTSE